MTKKPGIRESWKELVGYESDVGKQKASPSGQQTKTKIDSDGHCRERRNPLGRSCAK